MQKLISVSNGWTIVPQTLQECPPDRIRISLVMAGLCRTDIHAMNKDVDLPNETIIGHEAAGVVSFIPAHLKQAAAQQHIEEGSRVAFFPFYPCGQCHTCRSDFSFEHCEKPLTVGRDTDGAFASSIDVPLSVVVANDQLSWKHLAYAEPVAASMAVTTIPALRTGRVGIIGHGRIALLTQIVLNSVRTNPVELLNSSNDDLLNCFDSIVETAATEHNMLMAARALKPGGLLVVKSRPANGIVWPHQLIVMKRLKIIGAPYGSFQKGIEWMSNGQLNVDHMLGQVYPFTVDGFSKALQAEASGQETQGKLFFDLKQTFSI